MAYTNKPIDWQNEGTEPSSTLKTNGFEPGMKPAADTFNYFWHNTGECISELQTKVGDPANLTTTAKTSLVEATNENKQNIDTKVDKVTGKGLSTEDYTTEEKTKLAGIAENANNYTLPTASTTTKGGVKVGDNLKITGEGVLSGGYTRESLTDVISGETGKVWSNSNITSGKYNSIAYANGLWVAGGSSIKYSTDGSYARTEHTHDDIYYTEAEIDQKLSGPYGKPFGYDTIAYTYQTAIGRLNTASSGPISVTDTSGDLFIIGNGTGSNNRGNALRTTTAGKTYGQAAFANSGADYAEMWEIEGGNPNNEDWRGYFVTLNSNNKIEKASADSDFILGIVSGTACVLGDVHSEEWKNKYLRDVFGEKLTETVVISEEITDDDGNIVAPAVTETRWILNPEYDPTQEYISRENRKEWAGVGLVGKLVVIDDGTCTAGGYCKPTDNGTATKSETGWRVLERIDSTHIRVFFR